MKMRDLTRRAGARTVPAWPPRWSGPFRRGTALGVPGDGVLVSVTPANVTELRLTMEFDKNKYTGILRWDRPPTLDAVENLLRGNLGRAIGEIGDLDV